jgi:hypothetical protein
VWGISAQTLQHIGNERQAHTSLQYIKDGKAKDYHPYKYRLGKQEATTKRSELDEEHSGQKHVDHVCEQQCTDTVQRIMLMVRGRINEITHKALIVIFYSVSVGLVEFGGEKVMADLVAPE